MNWKRLRLLIVFVFFAMVACGGLEAQPEPIHTSAQSSAPSPEPTGTPEPTLTPIPTDTPLPIVTSTPIPTAALTPTPTPQTGETQINPETGNEETFSNAYGWVESHEIGTVIVDDGAIKVMTEQGVLPFSEQIVDRLETDQVDIKSAEAIVADKFVQIGNILGQVNSKSDQVIYGKDSQIFRFGEQLVDTINDDLVIMSRYGTGVQIWDAESSEWVETSPGTLAEVAPTAVEEVVEGEYKYALNAEGWKIAKFDNEHRVWFGFEEEGKYEVLEIVSAIQSGEFDFSELVYFMKYGQVVPLNTLQYDEDVPEIEPEGYFDRFLASTSLLLGRFTDENGILHIAELRLDKSGKALYSLGNVGYLNHSKYPFLSTSKFKTLESGNREFNPSMNSPMSLPNNAVNIKLGENSGEVINTTISVLEFPNDDWEGPLGKASADEMRVILPMAKSDLVDELYRTIQESQLSEHTQFITYDDPEGMIGSVVSNSRITPGIVKILFLSD